VHDNEIINMYIRISWNSTKRVLDLALSHGLAAIKYHHASRKESRKFSITAFIKFIIIVCISALTQHSQRSFASAGVVVGTPPSARLAGPDLPAVPGWKWGRGGSDTRTRPSELFGAGVRTNAGTKVVNGTQLSRRPDCCIN
jgi:hypothetical protein